MLCMKSGYSTYWSQCISGASAGVRGEVRSQRRGGENLVSCGGCWVLERIAHE